MSDGVELLADHYFSKSGGKKDPIVLMRSPYGRNSIWGIIARLVSERGYQVLIQSVRGTFGSGGEFDPEVNEARDGIDTTKWIGDQEWFSGVVGMLGPSYLGYVQWAIATNSPPEWFKAIAPVITASEFRTLTYPGETFALDSVLSWTYLIQNQEKRGLGRYTIQLRSRSALKPAFNHVPLNEADEIAIGKKIKGFQDVITNDAPGSPYWEMRDHSKKVKDVSVPAHLVGGWYDIFLPSQLFDYRSLKASGKTVPYLTIGPWTHANFGGIFSELRESISWLDVHLRGEHSKLRANPVRIYLMGRKKWLNLEEWPPREMEITRWYLQGNKLLSRDASPKESSPESYDYDPKDPTPSVGGIVLGSDSGPKDNRKLETRRDVLSYTSSPFERDYSIVGPVSVDLFVKSSLDNTDFFARICDVSPDRRSTNICDGMLRLRPRDFEKHRGSDGVAHVNFDLWPTANCFLKDHRLRLQVSSGAHPRFARNLGSGEPLATATTFKVAHQEIYHDEDHPSSVLIPEYPEDTSNLASSKFPLA